MDVALWDIDRLTPYHQNPRVNDPAVDAVAASIREFGFRQPIVVDASGMIIVGHARWKAAKKLGLTHVPVHIADLPPEKARAYRIADNQTNALSDWDYELLPLELKDLQAAGVDMDLLGFDQEALANLLNGGVQEGLTDPDSVPAPPDEATTRPGDLWLLSDHRLLCGDSSSGNDVDRLLDGAPVHLVNTDPPYNVKVEPRSNNAIAAGLSSFPASDAAAPGHSRVRRTIDALDAQGHHHAAMRLAGHPGLLKNVDKKMRPKDRPLIGDFVSDEQFAKTLLAWFGNMARVLAPGRAFYIWGGYANIANYPPALKACELYFSQTIVWVKGWPVLTRKDFMGNHEWAFYGWREGAAHKFYGPSNATDVWAVRKDNPQAYLHLTQKPVELAIRAIQYSSLAGENVLDLFGGSGSTLIAAEQTGRRAFLMEVDPLYCDVIVQRWEQFTGKKAERVESQP